MPFEQPKFEKPSQNFKDEKVPAERGERIQTPYEAKQELERKGVKKENAELASRLMALIGFLDQIIFSDNPAAFDFAFEKGRSENIAGFIRPEENKKERSYRIHVDDLSKLVNEEKNKKILHLGPGRRIEREKYYNDGEFFASIAAHEVRHRVQRDQKIKLFSPEDAKSRQSPLLSHIIDFCAEEFKEREKMYRKENKPEGFIKEKLGPKEFDASVIEVLAANKMYEISSQMLGSMGQEHYEKIIPIITMSAPEKNKE